MVVVLLELDHRQSRLITSGYPPRRVLECLLKARIARYRLLAVIPNKRPPDTGY